MSNVQVILFSMFNLQLAKRNCSDRHIAIETKIDKGSEVKQKPMNNAD